MTENPEPRWLTREEQEAWIALSGLMRRLPAALDAQLQRDAGINLVDYLILSFLSMQEHHRMSELAALAKVTLSHLSRVVTRLEKSGWIARTPDPQDGRFTLATLTALGQTKVEATAAGHAEAVRSLVFDPLTGTQVRHLREAGQSILRAVDANDSAREHREPVAYTGKAERRKR